MTIHKAAVIGAGLMGSGIAAHIANAGHEVVLLDIVPEGAKNRNVLAETAVEKLLKANPAAFMDKSYAKRIKTGNIDDHLKLVADADWIVEAVIEKKDAKQAIYKKLDAVRKPGSIVSSNTSTIPCADLLDSMPESFAADFFITHFFNPPRYMRLLEIVEGAHTKPEAVASVREFADMKLGKGVVDCKDTPGFIANRIGTYWIVAAVEEAMKGTVTIEEADAVMGRPMGIPKTGVFALIDLVGIDLMPLVGRSLYDSVPETDAFRAIYSEPELMKKMIAEGYTGRKGKGGFYRLKVEGETKIKEALDLTTGEYFTAKRPKVESVRNTKGSLKDLFEYPDRTAAYAWQVMSKTLHYAASLVPEIADDIVAVDAAMRLGYNWKKGPFELIDSVGADWLAKKYEAEGVAVPPLLATAAKSGGFYRVENGALQYLRVDGGYETVKRPDGVLLLSDIKRASKPIKRNGSASLWDIGDGVACFEFHTKMNAIDADSLGLLAKSIEIVGKDYKALVLHNEGSNFSVGMNLGLALFVVNIAAWPMIEDIVKKGQQTYKALKFAPFPVVGAPSGMALGGGCEVLLHCDAIEAHAESYIGLVEVGVGIVPGWGGCKELLMRNLTGKRGLGGAMPAISKIFETIGLAKVSRSAPEAKKLGFLRDGDDIIPNSDRLLAAAKAKALALADGYRPPEEQEIKLPGKTARVALKMAVRGLAKTRKATPHDLVVIEHLSNVLTGGNTDTTEPVGEDELYTLEREALLALMHEPATIARMEHMLETGKPLRN